MSNSFGESEDHPKGQRHCTSQLFERNVCSLTFPTGLSSLLLARIIVISTVHMYFLERSFRHLRRFFTSHVHDLNHWRNVIQCGSYQSEDHIQNVFQLASPTANRVTNPNDKLTDFLTREGLNALDIRQRKFAPAS